jgi:hypothetical protein
MTIRPVGAKLFRAVGRTDMTKPIVAFRNCAKAHKTSGETLTFGQKAKGTSVNRPGITSTAYEQHTACAPPNGRMSVQEGGSRTLIRHVGWTNKRFKSCKHYVEYSLSCDNSCIFQHDNS